MIIVQILRTVQAILNVTADAYIEARELQSELKKRYPFVEM